MNRVLICGSNGLLGQRLSAMLSVRTEYEVLCTSRERSFVFDPKPFDYTQLDITRRGDVRSLISSFQPDVILNAAAMTDLDWCDTNREEAWRVNVTGAEHLAEAARRANAHLVQVSTDDVFNGRNGPYAEDAQPDPLSYFGRSKLAGENAAHAAPRFTVVRSAALYGSGIGVRPCFPVLVLENGRHNIRMRIADDETANPTSVTDLAQAIVRIAERGCTGLYHVGGSEFLTPYGLAMRVGDVFRIDMSFVERDEAAEAERTSLRPLRAGLLTRKAETDLGMRFMNATEGLMLLKHELEHFTRN